MTTERVVTALHAAGFTDLDHARLANILTAIDTGSAESVQSLGDYFSVATCRMAELARQLSDLGYIEGTAEELVLSEKGQQAAQVAQQARGDE